MEFVASKNFVFLPLMGIVVVSLVGNASMSKYRAELYAEIKAMNKGKGLSLDVTSVPRLLWRRWLAGDWRAAAFFLFSHVSLVPVLLLFLML